MFRYQVINRAEFFMNMQYMAAGKVTIASDHLKALMAKYLLETYDIAAVYEVVCFTLMYL